MVEIRSVAGSDDVVLVQEEGGLVALDPTSGAERWRAERRSLLHLDQQVVTGPDHDENDVTRGHVDVRDARTGALVWKTEGLCAAPLGRGRCGDLLVFHCVGDGTRGAELRAVATHSGELRWKAPAPKDVTTFACDATSLYATRVAWVADHQAGAVHAFDVRTGTERWSVELPDHPGTRPAIPMDDLVVIDGLKDARALRAIDGQPVWSSPWPADTLASPLGPGVVFGQHLFLVRERQLDWLDLRTGEVTPWSCLPSQPTGASSLSARRSITIAAGRVFVREPLEGDAADERFRVLGSDPKAPRAFVLPAGGTPLFLAGTALQWTRTRVRAFSLVPAGTP